MGKRFFDPKDIGLPLGIIDFHWNRTNFWKFQFFGMFMFFFLRGGRGGVRGAGAPQGSLVLLNYFTQQ